MNLNSFVVVPNKLNSMKLKRRNLPEVHLDAVQLDQESRIIESRLQQLREDMSQEKEEREKSGGYRWKSVKATSHGVTKTKENSFQKLSAGKVKMRVLKGEPEELSRPTGKVPRPPPGEQGGSRKPRLRGKPCGQCEARAARLMCAECGEDYCVGCFAKFHQKGALKNHRMLPIQMEIQTSISALDVVSQFKRQIEPEGSAVNSKRKDAKWSQGALPSKPAPTTLPRTQHFLRKTDSVKEEEEEEEEESQSAETLLRGEFDEKESETSFQEALREWRQTSAGSEREEESEQEAEPEQEAEAEPQELWGLSKSLKVPTGVFAAQADLVQKVEFEVEFRDHGLSYMEKLLVKKHRRTPIEEYRPLPSVSPYEESPMDTGRLTDEEGLTAEEREMRRYCASLFAPDPTPSTSTSTCSPSTSSNQQDPAESPLSMLELEQMAGDSAVLKSTFTAELETNGGMMAEAEGAPMEPGRQEAKRNKEPCHPYVPTTPPMRSPTTYNQSPRPPVPTPSPQKHRSHLTPLPPTPSPPSPHSSTSRSARAMTSSLKTKPTLRTTSWSAQCKGRPQSAAASRQSSPCPLSSRPKSSGPSVPNPLPSRFKLTGTSLPEWTSRARTTLSSPSTPLLSRSTSTDSSPPTPLSFRSMSSGSVTPTPLSSRDDADESPPPDFTSRSKMAASPPSTARSSSSISTGSSTTTPLSSRDKTAESPPPDFTCRSKMAASPPSTASSSISTGSSTPTPPSSRDGAESPDFTFRSKATATPPATARSSSSKSNGPSLLRDASSELPPPELNFRDKSCYSPTLELTSRDKSALSPLPLQTLKSKSTGSYPPTPRSSSDKSPRPPELDLRDIATGSALPKLNFKENSPGSPTYELSIRGKSPGSTLDEQDFRHESPRSTQPELSFRGKSPRSSQPELGFRGKSPRSPQPELSFRGKSPRSPQPELSFRGKSPRSPQPELSFRGKSPRSPQPELSFRGKSPELPPPELASKYKSIESSPPTPLSTRSGSTKPPQVELPSESQPEPHTSPQVLLSVRLPQSASWSEPAQSIPSESPQPPPPLKAAAANRPSPTLSSAPQPRRDSGHIASSSETWSRGPELSAPQGEEDEEMRARAALWEPDRGEQRGQGPQAPKDPSGSDPDASLGSGLDPELNIGMCDQPVFFPDPSLVLHSLAFRPMRYTGLDGFLTLGMDPEPGSAPPSPDSEHKSQEGQDPVERLFGGLESWRPGSSLPDCADHSVMSGPPVNVSPRAATPSQAASPLQRTGFSGSTEGRPWSVRSGPRARPVSAGVSAQPGPRPSSRPRPQSSPWPRPLSQAAREILEIESVGRMEREDPLLEEEADCMALANLEEEFRLMSRRGLPCSSDPGAPSPPPPPAAVEARHRRPSAKRRGSGEGHSDNEEEVLRDKQNVASLP